MTHPADSLRETSSRRPNFIKSESERKIARELMAAGVDDVLIVDLVAGAGFEPAAFRL